jgi:hypothetical protein
MVHQLVSIITIQLAENWENDYEIQYKMVKYATDKDL